jgi:hypothetical protein
MTQYDTLPAITSSTVLTAVQMNYFKTNLDYLKNPRQAGDTYFGQVLTTINVTSLTYIDASASLNLSFHTSGEPVLYTLMTNLRVNTAARVGYLDVNVDGTRLGDATLGLWNIDRHTTGSSLNGGINPEFYLMQRLIPGLSAGLHTFKLQVAISAAGNFDLINGITVWGRPL